MNRKWEAFSFIPGKFSRFSIVFCATTQETCRPFSYIASPFAEPAKTGNAD